METYKLKAKNRELVGKKVSQLRKQKLLPAVLYGKGVKNANIVLELGEFAKVFAKAGSSALINLEIEDKKPVKILVGDLQRHPVTNQIIHADLQKVNMKEKIRTAIPLEIIGDSPAVVELEGNLITNKDEIEVECLPDDLIPNIEVDISSIKTFDDNIKVSDLRVPEGIELLADPEEVILLVTPPRSEEELEEELAETKDAEAEAVADLEAEAQTEEGSEEKSEVKNEE